MVPGTDKKVQMDKPRVTEGSPLPKSKQMPRK